jgi:hypothetical protein
MMQRELGAVDRFYGAGNWRPYPLATWLFHDKVLMYEHDLYEQTLAVDGEVLTWNAAFGLVNSSEWHVGGEHDPWLVLAARMQEALGPHVVGVALARFAQLAPGVTRSVFGDLTVDANLSAGTYDGIPADGFRATTADGAVRVQAYPGGHWLVVDHGVVRQPVGGDLAVTLPGSEVLGPDGSAVPATRNGGSVTFTYVAGADHYTVR